MTKKHVLQECANTQRDGGNRKRNIFLNELILFERCHKNIICILYTVQKRKRIFRGQLSLFWIYFFCGPFFQAVDDIFYKSDINKIGNVFENKRIKDPIHDFCWPYAWVCKFLSWILLKNNMRSMSYGPFSRAGSQKGEFFTPSTTSPIRGKREFDANESGEHIELFDIS